MVFRKHTEKTPSENTPKKHEKPQMRAARSTKGRAKAVQGPREGLAMATNVAAQVPRNITIAVLWVQYSTVTV